MPVRSEADEELKARFIAERGVTQCPPAYLVAVGKIDPRVTGPLLEDPERQMIHAPLNPWKRRQTKRTSKHAPAIPAK